jgi:hypothetical protein
VTEGRYLPRREPGHTCHPPGFFQRIRDGVRLGDIWECSCGNQWWFIGIAGWDPYRSREARAYEAKP